MSTQLTPTTTAHAAMAPAGGFASAGYAAARLLSAGVVAGPLFLALWALQAFTRDGFDPTRHPLSLLALGDLGFVQIANFVLAGALFIACAAGLRRVLNQGPGATWIPRLVSAIGAGLIIAGVFVTDAGAGFPADAPSGAPDMSWHGAVHEVGFVVVQVSWIALCLVLRRRFVRAGQRRLARGCVVALIAAILIAAAPDPDSFAMRIIVATALQFGLVAYLAARLRCDLARLRVRARTT